VPIQLNLVGLILALCCCLLTLPLRLEKQAWRESNPAAPGLVHAACQPALEGPCCAGLLKGRWGGGACLGFLAMVPDRHWRAGPGFLRPWMGVAFALNGLALAGRRWGLRRRTAVRGWLWGESLNSNSRGPHALLLQAVDLRPDSTPCLPANGGAWSHFGHWAVDSCFSGIALALPKRFRFYDRRAAPLGAIRGLPFFGGLVGGAWFVAGRILGLIEALLPVLPAPGALAEGGTGCPPTAQRDLSGALTLWVRGGLGLSRWR